MDQIFMAQHPNDDHYRAVTFGSPGALPQQGMFSVEPDGRITNYAVSDDPFVFLGQHRGEIADAAVKNLALGLGLAAELATVTHLTADSLLPSVRSLGADYVNDGATVTLPGVGAPLTIESLSHANLTEHDPATYVALTAGSTLLEPSLWTANGTLSSVAGNDSHSGGGGNDNITAGPGGGKSTITGGAGNDTIAAASGDNYLWGAMAMTQSSADRASTISTATRGMTPSTAGREAPTGWWAARAMT
jgi:Ca2+-binding RTX toxin-like protein